MFRDFIIDRIVRESSTIKSFYYKRTDNKPVETHLPGQFITLRVKPPEEKKELIRNYTLSDGPGKEYFRTTIKREEYGKVSRYLHDQVKEGDTIGISKPTGDFQLTINSSKPVVLLSGGVGITPMLSMLEFIVAHEPDRRVYFLHSSLNKAVQPMLVRLRELGKKHKNLYLSIHHSKPGIDEKAGIDYDYAGLISKDYLNSVLPMIEMDYFLCGPVGFMETMYQYLQEFSVNEENIHYEFFGEGKNLGTKPIFVDSNSNNFKVKFTKSNKEIQWDSSQQSILELAESAGLTPEFSCRMGTCSTCESTLLKGTIEYDPEPFIETPEGRILICSSKPVSNLEIEL